MREDSDKFDLDQDLQDLKTDIDKVSADLAHIIWKSTLGRVGCKISRRPFSYLLWAFGTGFACCTFFKLFRFKKKH